MKQFIIVDDDPVNNLICKVTLTSVYTNSNVVTFLYPREGLRHLEQYYSSEESPEAILLLDINMPEITGWDFLERFEKLGAVVRQKVRIYILSSSIHPADVERARKHPYVTSYLRKPLVREDISIHIK